MGFGKAFEFLVKDYAIKRNPDDEGKIKKMFLGNCVKKYIDDERARSMAERAAWLRNDESHYVRTFEDKDIEDLKLLLRLVVNDVENFELKERYDESMRKGS